MLLIQGQIIRGLAKGLVRFFVLQRSFAPLPVACGIASFTVMTARQTL
jgi:hypothetical protein